MTTIQTTDSVKFDNEVLQYRKEEREKERARLAQVPDSAKSEFALHHCNYSIRTNPLYKSEDYDEIIGRRKERTYYGQYGSNLISTALPFLTCHKCKKRFDTDPRRCYGDWIFYLNVNELIVWVGGLNNYYCYSCKK
jgi:hypothetical protein